MVLIAFIQGRVIYPQDNTIQLLNNWGLINFSVGFFFQLLMFYLTNRFHVAVCLFSNRSQRTSKCGKNISDTLGCALCATFLFLPHFDVICAHTSVANGPD